MKIIAFCKSIGQKVEVTKIDTERGTCQIIYKNFDKLGKLISSRADIDIEHIEDIKIHRGSINDHPEKCNRNNNEKL